MPRMAQDEEGNPRRIEAIPRPIPWGTDIREENRSIYGYEHRVDNEGDAIVDEDNRILEGLPTPMNGLSDTISVEAIMNLFFDIYGVTSPLEILRWCIGYRMAHDLTAEALQVLKATEQTVKDWAIENNIRMRDLREAYVVVLEE